MQADGADLTLARRGSSRTLAGQVWEDGPAEAMDSDTRSIRRYVVTDEAAVVDVWYRSGRAAYVFVPAWQDFTLETARKVFREIIQPACDIWVGVDNDRIVAYLALRGSYVDRMYVDPDYQRQGWGSRLLALARSHCPEGLQLHTHQANDAARQFYEKHDFRAVRFGVSPPPENVPDVEYHWRPAKIPIEPPARN